MHKKEVYVTDDGKEFSNKTAAILHEYIQADKYKLNDHMDPFCYPDGGFYTVSTEALYLWLWKHKRIIQEILWGYDQIERDSLAEEP